MSIENKEYLLLIWKGKENNFDVGGIEMAPNLGQGDALNILVETLLHECNTIIKHHNCNIKDCNIQYVATLLLNELLKISERKENRYGI